MYPGMTYWVFPKIPLGLSLAKALINLVSLFEVKRP